MTAKERSGRYFPGGTRGSNSDRERILVIAPHLDDEVLGCGGVIAKHVARGDEVEVCVVAHRVYNHVYEKGKASLELAHARKAGKVLGYKNLHFLDLDDERLDCCLQEIIVPLEAVVAKVRPEIVYSPFSNDNNQDHRAVARAAQVALRPMAVSFLRRWLVYETPSSTEQAPPVGILGFQPNVYCDISKFLTVKLRALGCYETEARQYPHPRSPESIRALAMKRGVEANVPLAEGFMLARQKW